VTPIRFLSRPSTLFTPTLGLKVTLDTLSALVQKILMMSNEEIEKKMAFIVEQQAQFASDFQRLQESQARTDQVVAQTGGIVARLANVTQVGFNEVKPKSMR